MSRNALRWRSRTRGHKRSRIIPRINHKDKIYTAIKTDIIRCALKPGMEVSEAKLAARYNVGKAPVRDALARLGHEGFVIARARKGHIIAPITIQDVIDLYGVRMALEPVAARLAAGRVDEAHLRQAAEACEVSFDVENPESVSQFLHANSEFHRAIANASGNRRMARQISGLLDDTERVRQVMLGSSPPKPKVNLEHRALVEALVEGDKDGAEALAKTHIQRGWRMVLSSLLQQFRFMDLNIGGPLEETTPEIMLTDDLAHDFGKSVHGAQIVNFVSSLGGEQIGQAPPPAGKAAKSGKTGE